ncbi:MAG: response regulator [Nitrospira sp.]|nr:response regulator [Nitrospira sp.]
MEFATKVPDDMIDELDGLDASALAASLDDDVDGIFLSADDGMLPDFDEPNSDAADLDAALMEAADDGMLPDLDEPNSDAADLDAALMEAADDGLLPDFDEPNSDATDLDAALMEAADDGLLPDFDEPNSDAADLDAALAEAADDGLLPDLDESDTDTMVIDFDDPEEDAMISAAAADTSEADTVFNDLEGLDAAALEAALADDDMEGIFLPVDEDAVEAPMPELGMSDTGAVFNDLEGLDADALEAALAEDMDGIFLPGDDTDDDLSTMSAADVVNDLDGLDAAALDAALDGDMDGILLPTGDDDFGDSAALDDSDLDFAPDADFGPDADFDADNILDVLRAELLEVSPQLAKLESVITATEDAQALRGAVQSYKELTDRLMLASESLGLTGLYELCRFVVQNIAAMEALDLARRQATATVLAQWTGLVLSYLQDPKDDSGCVMLISHFQDKAWPKPISGEKGRELYGMLSEGMSEEAQPEPVPERQKLASAEDVALEISPDASADLLDAFFSEAPAQTERFSLTISLIAAGENLEENIKVSQRIAHTLKGSGNLIGVKGLANLTHHVEDILEYLSTHRMAPPKPLADLMIETSDCLEGMIESLQGKGPPPADALSLLQRILDWANRVDKGEIRETDEGSLSRAAAAAPDVAAPAAETEAAEPEARGPALETLRVPTNTVDDMITLLGEVSIAIAQVKEHINRLLQRGKSMSMQDRVIQQRRFDLENMVGVRSQATVQRRLRRMGAENSENFDPLEMDQYDELYGTTHSFIEAVADSREMSNLVQHELSTLEGLFLQQQRLNKELQQLVMTTRMESANTMSARLHRAVRQACRATGKKVNLVIENEDMHVDSDVLSKLADPLMHMLRNAVDHGIEAEDVRREKGKPETGSIVLSYTREGNNVLVRCTDDGGGLNYDNIRATAVKKGLVGEKENLDKRDLGRMILVPGFSTRDTTTQISGRGVGMDVVHATILELKGSLDILESEHGGTQFVLSLPISLVTNHSLVVKTGEDLFAIPTNYLLQILAPDTGEVTRIGEEVGFQLGKEIYPARSLAALLNSSLGDRNISSKKIILLVKADTGNYAVTVDQLINSYELVVKSTGKFVRHVPGVAGVAVLGDGNVVPVLDLPDILRSSTYEGASSVAAAPVAAAKAKTSVPDVLIVDDSLSVRKSLAQFVKDAGFNPVLARDGLEAAEMLRKQKVTIALVDMEMPRMNGLELTRHIRATDELKNLPVIMITSRTQQKHRQQAEQAGVSRYLSKPYGEDDLLTAMEQLMGH